MPDVDLLVVQQHAIHCLDSSVGSLGRLVVDETIALRAAELIGGDLAREYVTESRERIMQSLFTQVTISSLYRISW